MASIEFDGKRIDDDMSELVYAFLKELVMEKVSN